MGQIKEKTIALYFRKSTLTTVHVDRVEKGTP